MNEQFKKITHFIELFYSMNEQDYFQDYFGIDKSTIDLSTSILKSTDSKSYLTAGLKEVMEELDGNHDTSIGETLFFYPLIGAINKISYEAVQEDEE